MAENRLAIVVDGTSKMAHYWTSIYKNFLLRIVRNFCHHESTSQDPSGGNYALGLIVYGANDCPSACPVQPSAWTRSYDIFVQWLSGLCFNGGGQNESAIAEGLSNALMMFPSDLSGIQSRQLGQRHCILVGANNPSPVPRAVLLPKTKILDSGEISEARIESQNADAEAVARSFPQSFVSLSVICPRQFSRLRAIYNAGNTSHQAAGSSANEFKHPQLLVLVSESFIEAHVALKQLEAESRLIFKSEPDLIRPFSDNFSEDDLKNLSQIVEPLTSQLEISGEERNYDNGNNLAMLWRKPRDHVQSTSNISANNILTEAEESGVNALRPKECRTWEAQCSYDQETSYVRIPSTEASSNILTSRENTGSDNFKVEFTPTGIVLSHGSLPESCRQVNSGFRKPESRNNIPDKTSWSVQVNSKASIINPEGAEISSSDPVASVDSSISGNMKISQPSGIETTGTFTFNLHQTIPHKSESNALSKGKATTSSSPGLDVDDRLRSSQLSADFQQRKRAGDHFCGAPIAKNDKCTKRKHFNAIGQKNAVNGSSTECVGRDSINQACALYSEGSATRYIKAWEGGITSEEQGQIVPMNRLVAYRKESQSEKLFANWPLKLHLDYLILVDQLNNNPFQGDVQYLTIDAVAPCPTLDQMEEKRLCAYIKLPQQTLILSGTHKKLRFVGTLFEGVYRVFKHQIYSP